MLRAPWDGILLGRARSNVTAQRAFAGNVTQRLRDSSTWLVGGYNDVSMLQEDWGGAAIDASESTLRYLPRQQTWSRHGGQPAARRDFAAVTLRGDAAPLLLVHGGWVGIAGVGNIASEEVRARTAALTGRAGEEVERGVCTRVDVARGGGKG